MKLNETSSVDVDVVKKFGILELRFRIGGSICTC